MGKFLEIEESIYYGFNLAWKSYPCRNSNWKQFRNSCVLRSSAAIEPTPAQCQSTAPDRENGFTDRANGTVRENNLQLMNKIFSVGGRAVCDYVKLGKIRTENGSYEPYGFVDKAVLLHVVSYDNACF